MFLKLFKGGFSDLKTGPNSWFDNLKNLNKTMD